MEQAVDSMVIQGAKLLGLDLHSAAVSQARTIAREAVRDGVDPEQAYEYARQAMIQATPVVEAA